MSSTDDLLMDPQGRVMALDYLRVILRAGWWILPLTIISAIVAFGVGKSRPKIYSARATILAPREAGPMPLGTMFAGANPHLREGRGLELSLPGMRIPIPLITTSADLFLALLKSRTMWNEVTAQFDQRRGAGASSMVLSVQPDTRDKGVLGLTAEATNPQIAAEIANYYFTYLDEMLQRFTEQAIKRQEQFYLTQLERAEKEIEAAQNAVLKFQAENRFLVADTETARTAVSSGTSIRASIMYLEMQRELLRMRFTDQHSQIRELEKQIFELKRQYSKDLFGKAMDLPLENPNAKGSRKEFFVPVEKMTPVQFQFVKLYRNLNIQEGFYRTALQNISEIRYRGQFSSPAVEILDHAVPSLVPLRPNIWFLVAAAAVTALMTGIVLASTLEYFKQVREAQARVRIGEPGASQ